jgi:hypothetical protein
MAVNPIWWELSRSSPEELKAFVDDIQLNVSVIPFVGEPGTDSKDGAYNNDELARFLRDFSRQVAQENISEVKT